MNGVPSLVVKPSRQFPFVARHPWAHAASLVDPDPPLECGAVVDLVQHDGRWLARGLFNPRGPIRVRLYSWDPSVPLDSAFFSRRIDQAIARRRSLGLSGQRDAVRLVFSESDGLSGLIVDRYGPYLAVQVTAAAMLPQLEVLVEHLRQRLEPAAMLVRTDAKMASLEGMPSRDEVVGGELPEGPVLIVEHGVEMAVDLRVGQKTGAYLDQRENHRVAAIYLAGRDVLDVCCYTGGFGLAAAKLGGAASVLGLDSSQRALDVAAENARRNGLEQMRFEAGDCFDSLVAWSREGKRFGGIVLDPPRFAGNRRSVEAAMRAYHRLNRSAVELLEPGGILVTCSCSGRVSRADFLNMLVDVSRVTRRDITVLEMRGAAADHPMRVSCPESDYLKCLICEIND